MKPFAVIAKECTHKQTAFPEHQRPCPGAASSRRLPARPAYGHYASDRPEPGRAPGRDPCRDSWQNTGQNPGTRPGVFALRLLVAVFLIAFFLPFGPERAGAACPSGQTVLYMPAPKGGQLDLLYDLLPPVWQAKCKSALTLEHLAGRGGSYAVSRLLDEEDNGCFLSALVLPSFLLLSEIEDRMYDAEDIAVAGVFASAPHALWVDENSPFKTLADLVQYGREESEKLNSAFVIAGTGSYSDQHLATALFNRAAGVKSRYYPVLGSAEALKSVKDGMATACWGYALPLSSMPGMRPLAAGGERRGPALPDVPTFKEVNVDMVSVSHFGIGILATVTEELLQETGAAVASLTMDEALRKKMADAGFIPLALLPKDTGAFMEGQVSEVEYYLQTYPLIPPMERKR